MYFIVQVKFHLLQQEKLVTGDIKEQTHQVFKNLQAVLKEAGASLETVIKATVFIKNMNDLEQLMKCTANIFQLISQLALVLK